MSNIDRNILFFCLGSSDSFLVGLGLDFLMAFSFKGGTICYGLVSSDLGEEGLWHLIVEALSTCCYMSRELLGLVWIDTWQQAFDFEWASTRAWVVVALCSCGPYTWCYSFAYRNYLNWRFEWSGGSYIYGRIILIMRHFYNEYYVLQKSVHWESIGT